MYAGASFQWFVLARRDIAIGIGAKKPLLKTLLLLLITSARHNNLPSSFANQLSDLLPNSLLTEDIFQKRNKEFQ